MNLMKFQAPVLPKRGVNRSKTNKRDWGAIPIDQLRCLHDRIRVYQGGFAMIIEIKVIYTDGTEDTVNASQFVKLLRSKQIAAIQCAEGWLEIRRNQIVGFTADYEGQERRKTERETD